MPAFGQDHVAVAAAQYQATDLGYVQIAMTAAAVSIGSVPTGARWALITVEGTATDTVRWRGDGTAPTAAIGNPIPVLVKPAYTWPPYVLTEDLAAVQFIGAATSIVNVNYFK